MLSAKDDPPHVDLDNVGRGNVHLRGAGWCGEDHIVIDTNRDVPVGTCNQASLIEALTYPDYLSGDGSSTGAHMTVSR